MRPTNQLCWAAVAALSGIAAPALAEETPTLVVTATRIGEPSASLPQSETLIDGASLRDRGVFDLRGALATAGGVEVLQGGDGGPAASVLAFHGLAEMDAWLLVVDGVPAGGAFNPATASFDPIDLEQIELLRGAAPVSFGATSFVGVVHALHNAAGAQPSRGWIEVGTRRSGRVAIATNLSSGVFGQSFLASAETRDDVQDRAGFRRVHLLYRAAGDVGGGRLHADFDGTLLDQTPNSPHLLDDSAPNRRFPMDSNVNPADARQDQRRIQANLGYDTNFGRVAWSTLASIARTGYRNIRGFRRDGIGEDGLTVNADGFRQRVVTTDLYVDSHVGAKSRVLDWVVGADWLVGRGHQRSANFEYAVLLDGSNAPLSTDRNTDESTWLADRRIFAGVYAQAIARPNGRLTLLAGARLNRTVEHRCASIGEGSSFGNERDCDRLSRTRLSVSVGASLALWRRGGESVIAFANYRNSFKPAAIDFGPEAEGGILKPETARGWEAGLRTSLADGAITAEASLFDTRFANLVNAENVAGLPALANAGHERLRGIEAELHWRIAPALSIEASYAHHIDRFTDYALEGGGGGVDQLAGNQLALSPKDIASAVVTLAPERGLQASATLRFVGPRFLDKKNSVRAGGYATIDARLGWRFAKRLGVYVRGENLTDRRDAISASELGDSQYYRLAGRRLLVGAELSF